MSTEYGILTEPSSLSTLANRWEMGWSFSVSAESRATGLRIKMPVAQTTIAHLWSNDGALLASTTITAAAGSWIYGAFESPVILSAGKSYIMSCYNTSTRYAAEAASFTFNAAIKYITGRYTDTQNAFPSNSESGSIYPLIDIVTNNTITHKTAGSAVYTVSGITGTAASSMIAWTEDKPAGTSVDVSVSTDGSNYSPVTNGGQFLLPGSYDNATAYIKVELATTDATITPIVSELHYILRTVEDKYAMVLEMEPLRRFENAAGDITVAYDGTGTLQGAGGPVTAFSRTFAPTELVPKPHQNDAEHISVASVAAAGTLTRIYYRDCAALEHISIAGITAVGKLTNVKDI